MKNAKLQFKIQNFLVFIFLIFLLSKPSFADEFFLDRPLGVEVISDNEVLVTDGGGYDWSNNGSEIFIFNKKNVESTIFECQKKPTPAPGTTPPGGGGAPRQP